MLLFRCSQIKVKEKDYDKEKIFKTVLGVVREKLRVYDKFLKGTYTEKDVKRFVKVVEKAIKEKGE